MTSKHKLNIQFIINIFFVSVSLFFIINFLLLYSNISEDLSDKFFRGVFLSQMIFSPIIAFLGLLNFFIYEKNEKDYNGNKSKFFIISLLLNIIPFFIVMIVWY